MSKRSRACLATLLGLIAALSGLEWWAATQAVPRVQQIKDDGRIDLTTVDGVPTWHSGIDHLERWNLGCAENGQVDVVILGSSIFYGIQLEGEETLGPQLAGRLDDGTGPLCVVNLAQPGSTLENQEASLRLHADSVHPRVVVWELWNNSAHHFTIVGDTAYNFGPMTRDSEGLPNGLGLPPVWNRVLFLRSAIYRYVGLSLVERVNVNTTALWERFTQDTLAPSVQRLREQGIQVVLVFTPPLSGPFAEHTVDQMATYGKAAEWATEHGVPWVDLAREFGSIDPVSVRRDPCCHYNKAGIAKVAQVIAGPVRELLD